MNIILNYYKLAIKFAQIWRPFAPKTTQFLDSLPPFPPNRLPTNGDVLKLLLLYHEQLGESTTEKFKAEDSCNSVTLDLIEIWEKATIPTMTYSSICRKVRTAYDSARYCERKKQTYKNKNQLFDIRACQCPSVPCSKFGCAKEICQEVHIKTVSTKSFP